MRSRYLTHDSKGADMQTTLDRPQILEARELAERTHARWKSSRGHYTNKLRTHFVGKVGEIAFEAALNQTGLSAVDTPFRDPERQGDCDFVVTPSGLEPVRIDLKTWRQRYWPELGRCVAIGQVDGLREKADVVVWTVIRDRLDLEADLGDLDEVEKIPVEIAGWSTIDEIKSAPIRATGIGRMRKVPNHQLDEDQLRPIGTLFREQLGT